MPRQETCRDAVCAFEAYPTARPAAIARAMRCPVRVHVGSDCAEPSQACEVGRPATTTRPCVLCVTVASVSKVERKPPRTIQRVATDGFNKWHQSSRAVRVPTFTTKSAKSRQQPWLCIRSDSDSLPAIPFPLRQALPRRVSVSSPSEYQGVCEKSKAFSRLFAAASRLPRGAKSQRVSMNFKIEVVSYVVLSTKRRLA